ncbi:MAG: FMN-binding protein [Ignavibacteria bacterium]|nr:FMN-binding protein [Ignavibacteria bacterium]
MNNVIKMILTLTVIGIFSGGLLSEVSNWATPKIKKNQKAEIEKAIFVVHPNGKYYEVVQNNKVEIYKVFDAEKNLIGYTIVNSGNGFQGKIKIMTGVNIKLNKITSIEILEQVETPGLGTKITEEPFKNQFQEITALPNIIWVKGKSLEQSNEIQTITGATISSKSVVEIVNAGIEKARESKNRGLL